MKRRIFLGLSIILVIWIGYRAYQISTTRSHSPAEISKYTYKDMNIKVIYGRPFKKGRVIFGEAKDRAWLPKGKFWTDAFRLVTGLPRNTGALVPDGKYWRLGANDATEITFNKNISFGGKPVNAGTYRMYAVPSHDAWAITLNSEIGKFGYFEPNYALDVVTVNVPVETAPAETEQFTIGFDSDTSGMKINFLWDKTLVRVPVSIQ